MPKTIKYVLNIIKYNEAYSNQTNNTSYIGNKRNAYRTFEGEKLKGKRPLGRPRYRGKMILKRILEIQDALVWTRLVWVRIRSNGGIL
jgi:hypothetical protein